MGKRPKTKRGRQDGRGPTKERTVAAKGAPFVLARDLTGQVGFVGSILANLIILGVVLFAFLGHDTTGTSWTASDFYTRTLQEDESIEWATFWGAVFACVLFIVAAVRQRRTRHQIPWFLVGVGCFCALFALEEISWGQRLFGYRPPLYFLEHNYQQEFNLHNVMDKSLHKALFQVILIGYGVALPILALSRPVRRTLSRLCIWSPPASLVPSFLATFWIHETYPFTFSGELVELMLILGLLFAAFAAAREFRLPDAAAARATATASAPTPAPSPANTACRTSLVVAGLGLATFATGIVHANVSRSLYSTDPEVARQARQEAEAIRNDFERMSLEHGRPVTACGLHRRVYRWVRDYRELAEREPVSVWTYHALVSQGLPEERAEFFLDPWNSPYWIRHECGTVDGSGRIAAFVYSMGPNRRRDSTRWAIGGDDVGVYFEISSPRSSLR